MAQEKKSYMPQSGAGLIRYFDVEESVQIKPQYVVAVSIAFGAMVLILKLLG